MMWKRSSDDYDQRPELHSLAVKPYDLTWLVGCLMRLELYAARMLTDGFVPRKHFEDVVPRQWREPLHVGGLIHRRGDACSCMRGHPWPDWGEIAVHDYLKHNPTRAQTDLNRSKANERKDTQLRAVMLRRDDFKCRYCGTLVDTLDRRSPRAAQMDHVDPNVACGLAGVVTACRSCNMRKGNRTLEAAEMTFLPSPTDVRVHDAHATTDTLGNGLDGTGRETELEGWNEPNPLHRPDAPGKLRPENFAGLADMTEEDA